MESSYRRNTRSSVISKSKFKGVTKDKYGFENGKSTIPPGRMVELINTVVRMSKIGCYTMFKDANIKSSQFNKYIEMGNTGELFALAPTCCCKCELSESDMSHKFILRGNVLYSTASSSVNISDLLYFISHLRDVIVDMYPESSIFIDIDDISTPIDIFLSQHSDDVEKAWNKYSHFREANSAPKRAHVCDDNSTETVDVRDKEVISVPVATTVVADATCNMQYMHVPIPTTTGTISNTSSSSSVNNNSSDDETGDDKRDECDGDQ